MKILHKLPGAALFIVALLFAGCTKDKSQKDLEDPAPATEQESHPCRVTKVTHEGSITNYTYDQNNRIISKSHYDLYPENSYFINYAYNTQGKVSEALFYNADSLPESKKVYNYDDENYLTGIYFYESIGGVLTRQPNFILFKNDQTGKRIRADFYSATQPNALERYHEYTYGQQEITVKIFNAATNPATLEQTGKYFYDTKNSPFYLLGYLNEYNPYLGKHNLLRTESISSNGNVSYSGSSYTYNNFGYPVEENFHNFPGLTGIFTKTYEYDCN